MTRIAFRVDASTRIGTGHVVRCLALADALKERGVECLFIHRRHAGHMAAAIRNSGFEVRELAVPKYVSNPISDTEYGQWLGVSPKCDARQTQEALGSESLEWLIVDHYGLGVDWECTLRSATEHIGVLDDLANRAHDCNFLLDQNYYHDAENRYEGLLPDDAQRLCGPRYALLRPEYSQVRQFIAPRRGPLSRILIFYGGTDAQNESSRALRVLMRPEFRCLAVDLVIGPNNVHCRSLWKQAKQRPRTTVHGPREHLVDLMLEADLFVGAGGTTTWERCALGLPSIVTAVAENQMGFNEALAADEVVHYLGHSALVNDAALATALRTYLNEPDTLARCAERAWRVTDGFGTLRAAEVIKPSDADTLCLRQARLADKSLYFEWANDPTTREQSHNPEPIAWSSHEHWFDQRLHDRGTWMWVLITSEGLPVGQVRAELHGGNAVLNYSIDPAFRGRGWGACLLQLAASAWRTEGADLPLTGEVRPGNEASRRAFLRAGFADISESEHKTDGERFSTFQSQS